LKKILVVDDNSDFLSKLSEVLSKQFQIYEAGGVNEALKLLEAVSVDLICSDYNMQDGTGLDILEILHRENKKIPFLLMSGMTNLFMMKCIDFYGITFCDKTDPELISTIVKMAEQ
jgi:DNA-binding NtrC family response regulator